MFSGIQQIGSPLIGSKVVSCKQRGSSTTSNNVLPLLYEDVMTTIADIQQEVVQLSQEQVTQAGLQVSGFSAGYCYTQFGISAADVMAPDLVDKDTIEDVGACLISQTYEFPFEEEELAPEAYRVINNAQENRIQHVQQRLQQELYNLGGSDSSSRRRRAMAATKQQQQKQQISDVLGGQDVLSNLIRSSSNLEMIAMLKNIFWYCIDNNEKQNTFSIDEDCMDVCYLHEGLATSFSADLAVMA